MNKLVDPWYCSFFDDAVAITYKKNEIILRPLDTPQGVYVISEGFVKSYSLDSVGDEHVHLNLIMGEIFPLPWAALGVMPNIYYVAQSDCTVLRLPLEEFTRRFKNSAEGGHRLFVQSVAQLLAYVERIHSLEFKYARDRLVYFLLIIGDRMGMRQADGSVYIDIITQRDIANSINLTQESLSREMQKLRRRGLIRNDGRTIVIPDTDALKAIIKDDLVVPR